MSSPPLWAVLPGGIDDPAAPSGGNRYDRAVLCRLHRDVHELAIGGTWPSPSPASRRALQWALADIPDGALVLVDGLVGCGVPELLAPHAHRLRLAVLVHLPLSDETGLSPERAADLRSKERATLHLATTVIATSEAAAAHVAAMHDLPRVEVAAPGVGSFPVAEPHPDGHRLLCVASVSPRKGQDLLVGALENDLPGLRWKCTFAGALINPVPYLSGRIQFTGPLAGADLDAAYAGTDLFVLPSRNETYGMVVTEALARGIPVLATAVGGVPEALGTTPLGRPGMLVPADDRPALAAALRAWLTDPSLRANLRAAALQRRETLPTWTATADRITEILDGMPPAPPSPTIPAPPVTRAATSIEGESA
ncbi:glycosyltransferase family 4 protein [Paractinoplanes atraurantiacus]|uniref:Glycosyltransferase involved in cell wall bisynthesis n=1 Tax=Paractinoplanes atraurantiacus TaxID=1036182 RepID=A0A285J5Q4_9ACTN|nr:glycosyltransferase family 4 protein [Actinoplanes atraurantiacus]SNY55542.1 Glycosyltransferase involved in cell wall bisynthesis [Actinoplanes atraurantiacus]